MSMCVCARGKDRNRRLVGRINGAAARGRRRTHVYVRHGNVLPVCFYMFEKKSFRECSMKCDFQNGARVSKGREWKIASGLEKMRKSPLEEKKRERARTRLPRCKLMCVCVYEYRVKMCAANSRPGSFYSSTSKKKKRLRTSAI
jgi:hypothetical protein